MKGGGGGGGGGKGMTKPPEGKGGRKLIERELVLMRFQGWGGQSFVTKGNILGKIQKAGRRAQQDREGYFYY